MAHVLADASSWAGEQIANGLARLLRVRWLVRAPIALYRRGLGRVFGGRLLMLEHIGRRSGLARFVVLEVVGHPSSSTYQVAAGFGPTSQWLRNVQAEPRVRLWLRGDPPRQAVAHLLARDEASAVLRAYAEEHPRAWSSLRPILERTLSVAIDPDDPALPIVALELGREGDPT